MHHFVESHTLSHEVSAYELDINPTCLLNGLVFFNPNLICLFKWANYVDPFIKFYIKKNSINLIDPKY